MLISKSKTLVIINYLMLFCILVIIAYLDSYYFTGYGYLAEKRAALGSAEDKYSLAVKYAADYNTHYRCPKIRLLNNACILSVQLSGSNLINSERRAGYWLEQALKQDNKHAASLRLLASLYLRPPKIILPNSEYYIIGELLPPYNYFISADLLKQSLVIEPNTEVYHILGWLYLRGLGVAPNPWLAKAYLTKAASRGYLVSQLLLLQEFGIN